MNSLEKVWTEYGWNVSDSSVIGEGHINRTYRVTDGDGKSYLLQKINTTVFQNPEGLMSNLEKILDHLEKSDYPYQQLEIIPTKSGDHFFEDQNGFWRALNFIGGCKTLAHTNDVNIAEMTAAAYADFIKSLINMPSTDLIETIPDFHNPEKRFKDLMMATENTEKKRLAKAQSLVDHSLAFSMILNQYARVVDNIPLRVTHNDTKISNILFKKDFEKVVAIVDFDTIMPGYVIHDFGDLVRSICNTAEEDEINENNVWFDEHLFKAISKGYITGLKAVLNIEEKENLVFGVRIIIYTQFIRFLTDYLDGDMYYKVSYPEQNLNRAKTHLKLLIDLHQKQELLEEIVKGYS